MIQALDLADREVAILEKSLTLSEETLLCEFVLNLQTIGKMRSQFLEMLTLKFEI